MIRPPYASSHRIFVMEDVMQGYAKLFAAVSLCTGMLGAIAGYTFHAPRLEPATTCNAATQANPISASQFAEPLGTAPWMRDPAIMDSSWMRWPTLTDF